MSQDERGLKEALAEIERLEQREADLLSTAQRYQDRYRRAEARLAVYTRALFSLAEAVTQRGREHGHA